MKELKEKLEKELAILKGNNYGYIHVRMSGVELEHLLSSMANQPPKSAGVKTVIMNKGVVWKGLYFDNPEQARNALKFHLPKRKFKEPVKNKLVCAHFGTTFIVTELTYFKDKDQ